MSLLLRLRSEPIAFPLVVFGSTRLAIFLVAALSLTLDPTMHLGQNYDLLPGESLCRWDCIWYAHVARDGYDQQWLANFFPLFPLLGRGVHWLIPLPFNFVMVLTANLAGLAALGVVFRVFSEVADAESARAGLLLWAFWPFSFFQAAGYPESLMALMTALTVYFALHRRHWLASAVLGLGILSRHLTLSAFPVLLIAQLKEKGVRPVRLVLSRSFPALFLPLALGGIYPLWQWLHFGNPMAWLEARRVWGDPAWYGIVQYLRGDSFESRIHVYVFLALIPTAGALLLLLKKQWWELAGYGLCLMVVVWAIGLMGLGRYTGAAWPAFLPLAAWLVKRPRLYSSCLALFAALQALFVYLYAHAYPIL